MTSGRADSRRGKKMKVEIPEPVSSGMNDFTGRAWLLRRLLDWLDAGAERVLLLTGLPGTGKSSLVAWLCGMGPEPEEDAGKSQLRRVRSYVKASHFCVANTLNSVPKALARNLAEQLTANVPDFRKALAASMADLAIFNAEVYAERAEAGSKITAYEIGHLDLGSVSETSSFNRVLQEPLSRLYEGGYAEPMLILIDALDEASDIDSKIGALYVLSTLKLPERARLLITTRPDQRVLKRFPHARVIDLPSDEGSSRDDMRAYVSAKLAGCGAPLRTALSEDLIKAADGNFLYARLVMESLLPRLEDGAEPADISFPERLSDIYLEFLNRELGVNERLWAETYGPLLGLIAVAMGRGLSRAGLEAIVGKKLRTELRLCQQYLSGNLPDGPFRPFHKSFSDYLLEDEENEHYHIDAADMHALLLKSYKGGAASWGGVEWAEVDDYGLLYLASHLRALSGEKGFRKELYDLLCRPFMSEKLRREGSYRNFAADVSLAIEAARAERPRNLVEDLRACFIYARLGWMSTIVPPEVIGALAAVGEVGRAEGYAALVQDAKNRCKALCLIGEGLVSQGRLEEARALSARALDAADKIGISKSYTEHLKALWEVLDVMAAAKDLEGLEKVTASVEEHYHLAERAQVFGRLAGAFARVGERDRAAEVARRAMAAAELAGVGHPSPALADVALSLAKAGERGGVELLLSALAAGVPERAAGALRHAAVEALAALGERKRAAELAESLFQTARASKQTWLKACDLARAAGALSRADEKERAAHAAELALAATLDLTDLSQQATAFQTLAAVIRELGNEQLATQAAAAALESSARGTALSDGGAALQYAFDTLSALGARAEMRRLAGSVAESGLPELALLSMARGLAKVGEWEAGLKASEGFQSRVFKSAALADVVKALMSAGDYERAFEVLKGIEYPATKREVLGSMSVHLIRDGQQRLAAEAAELALSEAMKEAKGERVRIRALGEVALALAKIGRTEQAAEVARRVFAEVMNTPNDSLVYQDILGAVRVLIQLGECERALELADQFGNPDLHRQVAEALAGVGETKLARSTAEMLLLRATFSVDDRQPRETQARGLTAASLAFAAAGELQQAEELAWRAFKVARIVEAEGTRQSLLCAVTAALSRAGDKEQALQAARQCAEATKEALRDFQQLGMALLWAEARANAVEAYVAAGDQQAAAEWAERLLEDAEGYSDGAFISAAARANAATGDLGALARVREAATGLNEVSRAAALIRLTHDFTKVGETGQALDCMCGALASIQTTTAGFMWETLGAGAAALAAIDGGETLWRVYEAVMEVDDWW